MYLFNLGKPNYGYMFNLRFFTLKYMIVLGVFFFAFWITLECFTYTEKGVKDYYVYGQRVYFNGSLQNKERELITSEYNIPLKEKKHVFYYGAIPYKPGEGININELPPKSDKIKIIQSTNENLEDSMRNTHYSILGACGIGLIFSLVMVLFLMIIF